MGLKIFNICPNEVLCTVYNYKIYSWSYHVKSAKRALHSDKQKEICMNGN
jgi:hypothetical protein